MTGEVVWGEGILIADSDDMEYTAAKIDAYPDGSGFMVSYQHSPGISYYETTVEAIGFDMEGNQVWQTQMNSIATEKTDADNSTGFHNGQNIIVWTNQADGNIYGQNIDVKGSMGDVGHPTTCLAPENLAGEYFYDEATQQYGALITWDAPETTPLHYNLYRYEAIRDERDIIEVDGSETSYFDEVGQSTYTYLLTAVYEDCESDFAITEDGEYLVEVVVTGINDIVKDGEIEIQQIYNLSGQLMRINNLEDLSNGIYIIKGKTSDGQIVSQKIVINNK